MRIDSMSDYEKLRLYIMRLDRGEKDAFNDAMKLVKKLEYKDICRKYSK